ncbi:unnamed protein product [Clonostachys solani]|uniref:Uncharacterized protein n=1 Tax=Clonostachys solani TaxID=160281 RepID=A0A9P0EBL7_9HYPO|nr:unnamed protein product [Clonostachys solani]
MAFRIWPGSVILEHQRDGNRAVTGNGDGNDQSYQNGSGRIPNTSALLALCPLLCRGGCAEETSSCAKTRIALPVESQDQAHQSV